MAWLMTDLQVQFPIFYYIKGLEYNEVYATPRYEPFPSLYLHQNSMKTY